MALYRLHKDQHFTMRSLFQLESFKSVLTEPSLACQGLGWEQDTEMNTRKDQNQMIRRFLISDSVIFFTYLGKLKTRIRVICRGSSDSFRTLGRQGVDFIKDSVGRDAIRPTFTPQKSFSKVGRMAWCPTLSFMKWTPDLCSPQPSFITVMQ